MIRLNAEPLKKVGRIEFGMTRKTVRKLLGNAVEFKKTNFDENTTDDFGHCHVFYDEYNRCEAIEIFNENQVYIGNNKVFPTDFSSAKEVVPSFIQDDDGLLSYELSIGIYAPDNEMESILFAKKGYYEEE